MQVVLIGWSVLCLLLGIGLAWLIGLADNPIAPRPVSWGEVWRCAMVGFFLAAAIWFFGCTAICVGREIISLIAG